RFGIVPHYLSIAPKRWAAAAREGREEKHRVYFSSSPCRHNQQNMAVLCRHVVTSVARGGTFGESVFLRPTVTFRAGRGKRPTTEDGHTAVAWTCILSVQQACNCYKKSGVIVFMQNINLFGPSVSDCR
ncbi:hypothetical protein KUCAC02_013846, partial [Chaenocephalus aceratus]